MLLIQVEFFTLRWLEHFSINFAAFLRDISALLGGTRCWGLEMMIVVSTFLVTFEGEINRRGNASQTHQWRCFFRWPNADACGSRQSFYDRNSYDVLSKHLKRNQIHCENKWIFFLKRSCRVEGFVNFSFEKGIGLTCFFLLKFRPWNSARVPACVALNPVGFLSFAIVRLGYSTLLDGILLILLWYYQLWF